MTRKDLLGDWVKYNDGAARAMRIFVGAASLLDVLFNRALSGIAPVADAGRDVSRAGLLTLGLPITNILTGLVWLSIWLKTISVVKPLGLETKRISSDLPENVVTESLGELPGQVVSLSREYRAVLLAQLYTDFCSFHLSLFVILQPLGDMRIAVIGGDTIRCFTSSDQTWMTYLADKVESTLSKHTSMATSTVQDSV